MATCNLPLEPNILNKPSISVVMPLYNKELEVARAIRSVLAQSFTDFELIIVNDGSTDRSVDQVNCFADARIRLVNHKNQGVSAARNRGVAESASDLVAFLDADDEWLPEFLATIMRLRREYPEAGVYATAYWMHSADGTSRQAILRKIPPGFYEGLLPDYFLIAAYSDPPLWTSAVAVDKAAFQKAGGFPVGIRCGEDLLTWARLASGWDVAYNTEALSIFWLHESARDRPGRFDDYEDKVGDELLNLYASSTGAKRAGMRHYLALWYRMRAHISLQLGERFLCIKSLLQSLRFGGFGTRLLLILILAISPVSRPDRIYGRIKSFVGSKKSITS